MISPNKKCTKCGVEKPATRYNWQESEANRDGFRGVCRDCMNAESRKNGAARRSGGKKL